MMRQQRKFISSAVSAVVSHPTLEQELPLCTLPLSQQQLTFLQDKGFWESQQGKQKLHVTSLCPSTSVLLPCILHPPAHTNCQKCWNQTKSYKLCGSKHWCFKDSQNHSFHSCYAHSLPWKMLLMLLQVLPWWQTPFSISIRMSCTFYS